MQLWLNYLYQKNLKAKHYDFGEYFIKKMTGQFVIIFMCLHNAIMKYYWECGSFSIIVKKGNNLTRRQSRVFVPKYKINNLSYNQNIEKRYRVIPEVISNF